jgi:ABC-type uncharacterized transport system permease subunit
MSPELVIALLAATVQAGTPILYATLGEIISERAGVLNLGVEGIMALASFAGFLGCHLTGSAWLGLAAGGLAGALLAGLHGLVCQVFLGNQVVSGLALTIFGVGLCNFLGTPYIGQASDGFHQFAVPLLSEVPLLGPIFFRQDALVYLSFFMPLLVWLLLWRTSFGLGLRAVGEMPAAASAAGLNPRRLRFGGVLLGGLFCGLGGAYLSLAHTHLWSTGLSGGRGWVAVALVIFAFWRPGRAVAGAYLFGGVMAFQLRLQASGTNVPSSLLLMLPYVLTVLVLVFSAARAKKAHRRGTLARSSAAPAALGVNIEPVG